MRGLPGHCLRVELMDSGYKLRKALEIAELEAEIDAEEEEDFHEE